MNMLTPIERHDIKGQPPHHHLLKRSLASNFIFLSKTSNAVQSDSLLANSLKLMVVRWKVLLRVLVIECGRVHATYERARRPRHRVQMRTRRTPSTGELAW